MLRPDVYWLREIPDLHFALMPRPRGGEWLSEEILGWHAAGIRNVVSLLERDEAFELGLEGEEAQCSSTGLNFLLSSGVGGTAGTAGVFFTQNAARRKPSPYGSIGALSGTDAS